MPKVRWVTWYGFVANFICFPATQKCENRLRFDKVTGSIKVGTFLRHSVHLTNFSTSNRKHFRLIHKARLRSSYDVTLLGYQPVFQISSYVNAFQILKQLRKKIYFACIRSSCLPITHYIQELIIEMRNPNVT